MISEREPVARLHILAANAGYLCQRVSRGFVFLQGKLCPSQQQPLRIAQTRLPLERSCTRRIAVRFAKVLPRTSRRRALGFRLPCHESGVEGFPLNV